MVGQGFQVVASPSNLGVRTVNLILLFRMLRNVLLYLFARELFRIVASPWGNLFLTDKWFVLVNQVVAAAIDNQHPVEISILLAFAPRKLLKQAQAFRIALPPVDRIDPARGIDKFVDHLDLTLAESLWVERHVYGDKPGETLI